MRGIQIEYLREHYEERKCNNPKCGKTYYRRKSTANPKGKTPLGIRGIGSINCSKKCTREYNYRNEVKKE
jgi:hypothetical protein